MGKSIRHGSPLLVLQGNAVQLKALDLRSLSGATVAFKAGLNSKEVRLLQTA